MSDLEKAKKAQHITCKCVVLALVLNYFFEVIWRRERTRLNKQRFQ